MAKEKASKKLNSRLEPSLFEALQKKCSSEYKTVSGVLRELIIGYIYGKKSIIQKNSNNKKTLDAR